MARKFITNLYLKSHIRWRQAGAWWRRNDKRYGWPWRLANGLVIAVVVFSAAAPLLQHILEAHRYQLSDAALSLVGKTDPKLTKQLTYDAAASMYHFNQSAIKPDDGTNPMANLKQQVGTASGSDKDKSLYALDIPQDASQGVTYHDINSQLSFQLTPQFDVGLGQAVQGRLLYPLADKVQAVYSLKNNGLKEDIVVPKAVNNTMSYSYTLNLPKTLEARSLPDGSGGIGIYGANPSLFGDISYGSPNDQALVQKARESGEKNYLVFGLPAPVIKVAAGSQPAGATARFELRGDGSTKTLRVVAEGLDSIGEPFTIDPSVVVSSTSELQGGSNNEGNISFGTSGQVTRDQVSGGGTSANWTTNTDTGASRPGVYAGGAAAYNGYLYTYARQYTNATWHVYYAPLNTNGSLGAWVQGSSDPADERLYPGMVIYNGYVYLYGGSQGGSNVVFNTVTYAAISSSDGSMGNWTISPNTMQYGVCRLGYAVANGYLYATGGDTVATGNVCSNTGTPSNYVQYAALNGDGSVGTWGTTTTFTTARMDPGTVTYNNFIYVYQGTIDGSTGPQDFQYAPLNSDGTVGAWITASVTSPGMFYRFGIAVSNGYLYMIGGGGGSTTNTVRYIQLNNDGSPAVSGWKLSVGTMATATWGSATAVYNGYLYAYAGVNSTGTPITSTQYSKIDPAGKNNKFSTSGNTALTNVRAFSAGVAYNGYAYVLGGNNSTVVANGAGVGYNDTLYAPINSDGTVGSWTATSTFVSAARRNAGAAIAYNGFMYYLGGNASNGSNSTEVQYTAINSNGSLGTWADTTVLPAGRFVEMVWTYNGRMYMAGGFHGGASTACNAVSSTYCTDVQMATINSNGTLGTWSAQAAMPTAMSGSATATRGQHVYLVGGDGGGGSTAVYQASMDASTGAISSWNTLQSLPATRTGAIGGIANGYLYAYGNTTGRAGTDGGVYVRLNDDGTFPTDSGCGARFCTTNLMTVTMGTRAGFIYKGTMYAMGGADATAASTVVETSAINNGGSGVVGTWNTTTSIATARFKHATVASNGYLYVLGGSNGSALSDVSYAPINTDGTVGTWATTMSLPVARYFEAAVASNGYMYVLGGSHDTTDTQCNGSSSQYCNDVSYAPINANGTLGSWTSTTSFTTARFSTQAFAYNSYMYILGGATSSSVSTNDVQYAPINSNGTVGTWTATTTFTTGRNGLSAVAYNGYAYVLGGNDNSTTYNDVQSAPIISDGTIGTWTAVLSFVGARVNAQAAAYNGYLYLMGGTVAGSASTDVQYATINTNGTLGAWSTTTNFATARNSFGAAVYKGYLYIMAGNSSPLSDVQYVPLDSMARTGRYSKLVDLTGAANITGLTYSGGVASPSVSVTFRAAGADGVFGTSARADQINGLGTCEGTSNVTNVRYLLVSIVLDDSYGLATSGAYSDVVTTPANVTDFTINYSTSHPDPSIRLKLGKTLQNGALSALDTCKP